MKTQIRYKVYGDVQGVGYRDFIRRRARDLELDGYVRNLGDGTVEIEAAGPADALSRLRDLAAQGPHGARVARLEEVPMGAEKLPSPFEITW
jgi:acylphosphatase